MYYLVVYKTFVDFYSIQLKLSIGTVNLLPVSDLSPQPGDDDAEYTQLCVHTNLQLSNIHGCVYTSIQCVHIQSCTVCTHGYRRKVNFVLFVHTAVDLVTKFCICWCLIGGCRRRQRSESAHDDTAVTRKLW